MLRRLVYVSWSPILKFIQWLVPKSNVEQGKNVLSIVRALSEHCPLCEPEFACPKVVRALSEHCPWCEPGIEEVPVLFTFDVDFSIILMQELKFLKTDFRFCKYPLSNDWLINWRYFYLTTRLVIDSTLYSSRFHLKVCWWQNISHFMSWRREHARL